MIPTDQQQAATARACALVSSLARQHRVSPAAFDVLVVASRANRRLRVFVFSADEALALACGTGWYGVVKAAGLDPTRASSVGCVDGRLLVGVMVRD